MNFVFFFSFTDKLDHHYLNTYNFFIHLLKFLRIICLNMIICIYLLVLNYSLGMLYLFVKINYLFHLYL